MDETSPVRYWHADFSVYGPGLTLERINQLTEEFVKLIEKYDAFTGGGFYEVDADGNELEPEHVTAQ